jgi:hypothetical protein
MQPKKTDMRARKGQMYIVQQGSQGLHVAASVRALAVRDLFSGTGERVPRFVRGRGKERITYEDDKAKRQTGRPAVFVGITFGQRTRR